MSVPYPADLFTEVHPGLWLGGSWRQPSQRFAHLFDAVITVCWPGEGYAAPPCGWEADLGFEDGPLLPPLTRLASIAQLVASEVQAGHETLVRCYMGLNRSAMVVAHALHLVTGSDGLTLTEQLRQERSPYVLFNEAFAGHVASLGANHLRTTNVP